jgi:tripartite-type tricarboxylate transporter receptor subunit TctC
VKKPSAATLAIVIITALCTPSAATAQAYPSKPIRFVIPFPAGGFSDVTGRVVAQKLSDILGQPIISDNRPGAGGNIGADIAAKANPDGYTLLINSINFVINPSVIKPPFDPLKDFAGVSLIASGPPLVMTVSPASPWKSVQDVIDAAKAKPGKLNFAISGPGSSPQLITEMLKMMTGINVVQVPFKGSTLALTSVISGDISVVFPNLPVVIAHLKSGRLRALAVTSANRSPALPDVPTMAESGLPGFDIEGFLGLLAPAKTPRAVINKLSGEIAKIAKQPDFVARYAAFGMRPVGSTPEEIDRFTRDQIAKWAKVLKQAGYVPH